MSENSSAYDHDGGQFCVVLYYHYTDIADPAGVSEWQSRLCDDLNLKGRVRVAHEGINGTLAGAKDSINAYITAMEKNDTPSFYGIQWKLSGAVDRYAIEEQQFKYLSVKVTKEVVSLDLSEAESKAMLEAGSGPHLAPEEFHRVIEEAADPALARPGEEVVLVDVRNVYETEIGRFRYQDKSGRVIEAINPGTRKFTEFSNFVEEHMENLRDKKVLMYCTGGVRCERASAYMRSKGIKDVYQLAGGIHCYQERFPDGGFFQGKNFVYDPRIALPYPGSGPAREQVVGRCRVCSSPFDDYAAQVRCRLCRMLQLVCDDCRAHDEDFKANGVVCKCCPAAASAAKPGKPRRANAVNTSSPTTDSISPAADKSDKELRSAQSSSPSVWRSIENTAAPSETGGAQAGSIHGSSEINHDTHDTVAPTICNSINCSGDDGVDVSRGGV